jgi:signal transduction histidine kinase/ActR/RegA family two-component response regulator/PAS domain-containing protein
VIGSAPPEIADPGAEALFSGPGEMRARCRTFDWGATPLGPVETWAAAFCAAVRICLDCGLPSSVQGGADRVLLYNDAYVASLGTAKHPWALGRPTREVWPAAVKQMDQNWAALLAGGPPVHHDDARFVIERDGRYEETYWTYAISLIRDASRSVLGLLTFAIETTARVRAEDARRASEARQAFLLTLSDAMRRLTDPNELQAAASRLLGAHLGASQAMYAEVDGEPGDEHGTVRGQYVQEGTPFPARIAYSAFGRYVGERYRRGENVVVSDVLAHPEFSEAERAVWLAAGIRAAIGVSLVKKGRFVTNFGVVNATPRAWTAQEVALVRETAERTWEAAERARAEAARDRLLELERRARAEADAARDRTERLQRLSAELTRCATVDAVVSVVVHQIVLALGARQVCVFELAEDARELQLLGAEGIDNETLARIARVSVDTPLPLGEMIRTRVPVVVGSSSAWQLAHPDVHVTSHDYDRAWAALPLRVEDAREERLLGALTVSFVGPRKFADEEVGFLQTFADLCAQALARTRLVEAEHLRAAAEAARAKAEAESRAKDDLLAAVSHELRAPLAPARALAQALARKEVPPDEVHEMAAEIDRHIAYQARLVADLLDYQRVTRGHLAMPRQRCDVHAAARSAMRAAGPALNRKLIPVTEEFTAADPFIWADPVRVQQIVYNLLSNAGKFSPHRTPVVIRTWNPTPGWVELAVADKGFGISHEVLEHLFEPFVQGESRQAARSGLGLGLALSRRLAELQGGTLTAESEGRGRGATFTLRLPTASEPRTNAADAAPVAAAPDSPAEATDSPTTATDSPTDGKGALRILVIEDDASAGRALRRLLTLDGHTVHVAQSLAAAERIAGAEPLDVVLADLHLGTESGLDAPRRLAEAAQQRGRTAPPTIVLSGFDRDSDLAESRAAGFVAHLAKPVEESALLLAVRRAAGPTPLT